MTDPRIITTKPAGPDHQVVTTVERNCGSPVYRREPCQECPWRKDAPTGEFPPEAFRHSAKVAKDMAASMFACHMSGIERTATCAGFLLSTSAHHNMAVRLQRMQGRMLIGQVESNVELFDSYRDMAEANGVATDDQSLVGCR